MSETKERKMSQQLARNLLTIHEEIIHGCLKSLQLYPHHPDYEDYVQIGRLALLGAYENFPQDFETEQEIYQFTGYAYTRVRWKIIDEIRKVTRHHDKKAALTEEVIAYVTKQAAPAPYEHIEFAEVFKQLWQVLEEQEKAIVKTFCERDLNYTEVATLHNISRRTVYNLRKKIQQKWLGILNSTAKIEGAKNNE